MDPLLGEGLRHGQWSAGQAGQLPGAAGAATHAGVDVYVGAGSGDDSDVITDKVDDLRDH